MTELITLFVPVVLLCETQSVAECQLVQHQGYFVTKKECVEFTQRNVHKVMPKRKAYYADSWCVEVKVQRKVDRFIGNFRDDVYEK